MIPPELKARTAYWKYTRVPMAMIHKLRCYEQGPLLDVDISLWTRMGAWGQIDGRITISRTKLARILKVGRKTLYRSLERLHEAGSIRWEETVDKHGEPLRNVVMVSHDEQNEADDTFASGAHPEEGGAEFPRGGGSPMTQGWVTCDPGGGSPVTLRNKEKEEQNEEGKPKTATADADAIRLPREGDPFVRFEKRGEKGKEGGEKAGDRKKRATLLAPSTNVPRKPIEAAVEETTGRVSPKGKTTRSRSSSSAPSRNPSINRLWVVWTTEIKARWPEFAVPLETPKHIGQVRHLFKQFGEENAAKIIRVAVWDWSAVRETIMIWKTKDVSIPQIGDILVVSTQLAGHVERGVTSPARRVSAYHKKFVAKPVPSTSKSSGGLSLAAQMREKYRTHG